MTGGPSQPVSTDFSFQRLPPAWLRRGTNTDRARETHGAPSPAVQVCQGKTLDGRTGFHSPEENNSNIDYQVTLNTGPVWAQGSSPDGASLHSWD